MWENLVRVIQGDNREAIMALESQDLRDLEIPGEEERRKVDAETRLTILLLKVRDFRQCWGIMPFESDVRPHVQSILINGDDPLRRFEGSPKEWVAYFLEIARDPSSILKQLHFRWLYHILGYGLSAIEHESEQSGITEIVASIQGSTPNAAERLIRTLRYFEKLWRERPYASAPPGSFWNELRIERNSLGAFADCFCFAIDVPAMARASTSADALQKDWRYAFGELFDESAAHSYYKNSENRAWPAMAWRVFLPLLPFTVLAFLCLLVLWALPTSPPLAAFLIPFYVFLAFLLFPTLKLVEGSNDDPILRLTIPWAVLTLLSLIGPLGIRAGDTDTDTYIFVLRASLVCIGAMLIPAISTYLISLLRDANTTIWISVGVLIGAFASVLFVTLASVHIQNQVAPIVSFLGALVSGVALIFVARKNEGIALYPGMPGWRTDLSALTPSERGRSALFLILLLVPGLLVLLSWPYYGGPQIIASFSWWLIALTLLLLFLHRAFGGLADAQKSAAILPVSALAIFLTTFSFPPHAERIYWDLSQQTVSLALLALAIPFHLAIRLRQRARLVSALLAALSILCYFVIASQWKPNSVAWPIFIPGAIILAIVLVFLWITASPQEREENHYHRVLETFSVLVMLIMLALLFAGIACWWNFSLGSRS